MERVKKNGSHMRKVLGFADVMNQQKKQTVNLEEERSFPISELNGFALVQPSPLESKHYIKSECFCPGMVI